MAGIPVVFGGAAVNDGRPLGNMDVLPEVLDTLEQGGCKTIDTAALYGKSEELLGKAGAGKRFTIDTKAKAGFVDGNAKKDNVIAEAKNSREMLGCDVDIYYLHAPDKDTPLEETLEGINEVYKTGFFKRFGLSNFKAADVQKAHEICKEKGYPLPKVYQGNYNPVARKQEELLFPTLRKLGIAFYCYSPIAGGFLTKTKKDIADGKGRFDMNSPGGRMYGTMYGAKTSFLEALEQWESIAKDEGIPRAELAYRWVTYNSPLKREYGDAIIIGASSVQQLKETLKSVNAGPLSDKAVRRIDELWKTVEHEAPLDNYHK